MDYRNSIHKFENLMEEMELDEGFNFNRTYPYRQNEIKNERLAKNMVSFRFSLNSDDDIEDDYKCGKGPWIVVEIQSDNYFLNLDKVEAAGIDDEEIPFYYNPRKSNRISFDLNDVVDSGNDEKLSVATISFNEAVCRKKMKKGQRTKASFADKGVFDNVGRGKAIRTIATAARIVIDYVNSHDTAGAVFLASGLNSTRHGPDARQRLYEKAFEKMSGEFKDDVTFEVVKILTMGKGMIRHIVIGKKETIRDFKYILPYIEE